MSKIQRLRRECIYQHSSFTGVYQILNPDGSVMDLTSRDVLFRLVPDSGAASVDRFSGNAGETGFPTGEDGSQGNIFPVFSSIDTVPANLPTGMYQMFVWVKDGASTPDAHDPIAKGPVEVLASPGGDPVAFD